MRKVKYYVAIFGVIVLVASLLLPGCAKPQQVNIRCLGSTQGTAMLAYCQLLAKEWDQIPGVTSTAFAGSVALNQIALEEGNGEQTMCSLPMYMDAVAGRAQFEGKPVTKLRFLWRWAESYFIFVVRADSDIHSISDLKDKVINSGAIGSPTNLADFILEAYGITEESVAKAGGVINRPGYADGAKMLQDKTADCQIVLGSGWGMHKVHAPLDELIGLRVLPVDDDKLAFAMQKVPGMLGGDYPGGIYKNEPNPVPAAYLVSCLVVVDDLPEDVVYEMMVRAWDPGFVDRMHDSIAYIRGLEFGKDLLRGSESIPMHPGAVRFYKEKGMM